MSIKLPHTITNCVGETLSFQGMEAHPDGERLIVENEVAPGQGPVMHTHWQQDEALTVVSGRMGYLVAGGKEQFAEVGETVVFKRGTPHRFWAEGQEVLKCKGWIQPANSIVFFLSSLFEAQKKSGSGRPEVFDGAYLITKYSSEYDLPELPGFVKKVVMPVTCGLGKLLGKYGHFNEAPKPLGKVKR